MAVSQHVTVPFFWSQQTGKEWRHIFSRFGVEDYKLIRFFLKNEFKIGEIIQDVTSAIQTVLVLGE